MMARWEMLAGTDFEDAHARSKGMSPSSAPKRADGSASISDGLDSQPFRLSQPNAKPKPHFSGVAWERGSLEGPACFS